MSALNLTSALLQGFLQTPLWPIMWFLFTYIYKLFDFIITYIFWWNIQGSSQSVAQWLGTLTLNHLLSSRALCIRGVFVHWCIQGFSLKRNHWFIYQCEQQEWLVEVSCHSGSQALGSIFPSWGQSNFFFFSRAGIAHQTRPLGLMCRTVKIGSSLLSKCPG